MSVSSWLPSFGTVSNVVSSFVPTGYDSSTFPDLSGQGIHRIKTVWESPLHITDTINAIVNPSSSGSAPSGLYCTPSTDQSGTQSQAVPKRSNPTPRPRRVTFASETQTDAPAEELSETEEGRVWRLYDKTHSDGASRSRNDPQSPRHSSAPSGHSSAPSGSTYATHSGAAAGGGATGILGTAGYFAKKWKDSLAETVNTTKKRVLGVAAAGVVVTGLGIWALADGVPQRAWEGAWQKWDSYASVDDGGGETGASEPIWTWVPSMSAERMPSWARRKWK